MPDQPLYSIGTLARILGVPAATLRTWEERYGIVVPDRSPAGHRLYSRLQVEQLRFVSGQVAAGLSAADAYRLLEERVITGMALGNSTAPPSTGSLLLLVERDPYAASFAEYFLKREGHGVIVASTVEQALAETVRHTPDLAVIDLLVSDGQGLRLCAQLRRQLDIPVLAISTFGLRDDALRAGAGAFLLKPLQPRRLADAVQDLLGLSSRPAAETC
jgi:DNA-binding transcriptional MerR regulator